MFVQKSAAPIAKVNSYYKGWRQKTYNKLLLDYEIVYIYFEMRIIRADLYYYSCNCVTLIRSKQNGKRKHMFSAI